MSSNKKGLSDVVAVVLILVITIAAVALVVQFLIPFVKNNLDQSSECLDVQEMFHFQTNTGVNCFSNGNSIIVSVLSNENDPKNKVAGFDLLLENSGFGKSVEVTNNASTENLTMNYGLPIKVPGNGEYFSYNYTDGTRYTKAELKTLLKNGKICDLVSDNINLEDC